jgi:hypothetical protein
MEIIEEFFKKNNFEMPRQFVEDEIGTPYVKYKIKSNYLFEFAKKMTVIKGEIH